MSESDDLLKALGEWACDNALARDAADVIEQLQRDLAAALSSLAEARETIAAANKALRWVYANGVMSSFDRPEWVSYAFDRAYDGHRVTAASPPLSPAPTGRAT